MKVIFFIFIIFFCLYALYAYICSLLKKINMQGNFTLYACLNDNIKNASYDDFYLPTYLYSFS